MPARLEIAANSLASAIAAQAAGAHRVELCSAHGEGGLTPSCATIALARERLHIPLHVLIRPRGGDFLYDDLECETMQRDIEACVALGCDGVVLGVLDADGRVDAARCRPLVAAAGKLGVTFNIIGVKRFFNPDEVKLLHFAPHADRRFAIPLLVGIDH